MLLSTRPQRPQTLAACPLAHLGMTCLVGLFCRIFCFALIPQISSVTRCRDTEERDETSILAWRANLFLPCNVSKRFWADNRSLNTRMCLSIREIARRKCQKWFRVAARNIQLLATFLISIKALARCPTPNICFLLQSGCVPKVYFLCS